MKKSRLNLILVLFLIAFFVLFFRLFQLTIVEGEKYRSFSDTNRIKEVNLEATRGIIYDRNGKNLATNKATYNLVAYKDRFDELDRKSKNDVLSKLITILDQDGINYLEDYFISLNEFVYEDENSYFTNKQLPTNKVIQKIQKENLLKDIFLSKTQIDNGIYFYPIKRVTDYLSLRGKTIPIEVNTGDVVEVKFIKNSEYEALIDQSIITENTTAMDYLTSLIENDDNFIYYIISHPFSRKIVYDLLVKKGIQEDLNISNLTYKADIDYIENKARLNKYSKSVTLNSNPKDDFINLVKENSLSDLLTSIYKSTDSMVVPVSTLINKLEKSGIETNIEYTLDEENLEVHLKYKNEDSDEAISPEYRLIDLATQNKMIDEFILSKDIITYAERSLFDKGIYPRIYKDVWEYSYLSDKEDMIKNYDSDKVEDVFTELTKDYELESYDEYFKLGILSINNKINEQGYLAYTPKTIAKNINNDSLLKIEEMIPKDTGFEVVIDSMRYYPHDNLASHVLGYIGSISENSEVEEYIQYKKYDANDKVGKSGLEQSFEDTLRGVKGRKLVYTDVYGQTTDTIEEISAVPGNNVYTTIDLEFQKQVERITYDMLESLREGMPYQSYFGNYDLAQAPKAQVASVVVMNAKTGEILAMVSTPDYNPNLFVNGISTYDWDSLNNSNPDDMYAPRPIVNNVIQSAFPPGSTFKPLVSLAALENGLNPNATIDTSGFIEIDNNKYYEFIYSTQGRVWGRIDLYTALEVSSNYYFYTLGLGYNPNNLSDDITQVSVDDIQSMTKRLGMQDKTGIEIDNNTESSGYIPSVERKLVIVRSQLNFYLRENLASYASEDVEITDEKLENDITNILAWLDKGSDMSRTEVIDELEKMGYEALEPLEGRTIGLADIIKYSYINVAKWDEHDKVNMVIGQGQNSYTPIQMVQYAAILGNEGKFVHPTLLKAIKNYKNTEDIFVNESKITDSGVDKNNFKIVKEGMRRASLGVQFRSNFPFEIGSKTGTADVGSIDPKTGDFYDRIVSEIAFAPFDEPEIAVYFSVMEGAKSENVRGANNDIIYAYYKYIKKDPRFTLTRPGEDISSSYRANKFEPEEVEETDDEAMDENQETEE
ncbi:penicillin-binding transpeptidase domain-containing protein [Helcococcus sueciensis]|uniref:penicillin-binding transpeptidase domain-containing protein n=1 Tax=Helcococcus sueciensis TaxID=241555 RepID=UPI00040293A0|nr:penicillin-binding transpeptidase domain-containing protein [Helcococcus sueciensis]